MRHRPPIVNKKLTCKLAILIFMWGSLSIPSTGQELRDTMLLDEIKVTASKISIIRDQTPFTLSSLDEELISESTETALLPILSEKIPGVFVTERGITGFGVAQGSAGQVSIRGIGGSPTTRVLILLNGNPQYMGLFGHPLADSYMATDIQSVEVIKGPASILYGSNAMGGAINIVTKKPNKEGIHGKANIMYGSFNTQKYSGNISYKKEGHDFFTSGSYEATDGHRDSSDFASTNFHFKSRHRISNKFDASANYMLNVFESIDPGSLESSAGNQIDIMRSMASISLNNNLAQAKGTVSLFANWGEHEISDGFRSKDFNIGFTAFENINLTDHLLASFGIDYKSTGGNAKNIYAMQGSGIVFIDTNLYEASAYTMWQYAIFEPLSISAGIRFDHHEHAGWSNTPALAINYRLNPYLSFRVSVSKGHRNPTIRELFMWGNANDELRPEKATNYEVGIQASSKNQQLKANMCVYHISGSNLIQSEYIEGRYIYSNSGNFENSGFELSFDYETKSLFSLHANYSFIDLKKAVISSPRHQVFASLNYPYRKWRLNVSWQLVDGLFVKTGENEVVESYNLLNARIAYALNKFASLSLKAENITESKYQINYGYPMPGATFFVGLKITI